MNETETFKFIEVVQGHEELWNISSYTYKDIINRKLIWDDIIKKFSTSGEKAKNYFIPSPSPQCSSTHFRNKKSKTVEEIFENESNKLLSCLESSESMVPIFQKYNSAVVEFIVETLVKLNKEEADACEKELMKVATKFRYNY
ncbi:uncharacterized protein LOC119610516 [Lucilia sericata]|uniref:uncharacterized protein LOC119610516 n=1 Tax=Lucilia sericata TaxID=13632 RepID=UPI0018A81A32|nr:uncharacterized protein LOC119610516 [Lucilia sericata]